MQQKANEYAELEKARLPEKYAEFKALTGWLSKVLICHNLAGKSLHGKAAEMTNEERATQMNICLNELHQKIKKENITPTIPVLHQRTSKLFLQYSSYGS